MANIVNPSTIIFPQFTKIADITTSGTTSVSIPGTENYSELRIIISVPAAEAAVNVNARIYRGNTIIAAATLSSFISTSATNFVHMCQNTEYERTLTYTSIGTATSIYRSIGVLFSDNPITSITYTPASGAFPDGARFVVLAR